MVRRAWLAVVLVACSPSAPIDPPRRVDPPRVPPPVTAEFAHPLPSVEGTPAPSALADLDHDGHADLLIGRTEGPPPIELADVHLVSASGARTRASETIPGSASCGLGELPLFRLGDLDGDGLGELGAAHAAGYEAFVTIVHGHAPGTPPRETRIASPVQGNASCFGQSIVSADVDGDGHLDLIVGAPMTDAERGSVFVYRSQAGAIPSAPSETIAGTVAGARFGSAIGVCDLSGDARPDLIAGATEEGSLAGALYVLERGATGFASPGTRLSPPDAGPYDRFGRRVETAIEPSGRCTALVGAMDGVREIARGPVLTPFSVPGSQAPFALGDVTGDGAPEAIVCDQRALRVHVRGAEAFAPAALASIPLAENDQCADLAVPGDLNRDGRADVVVGIRGYAGRASEARVFYGIAGGLMTEPRVIGARTGEGSMAFASWVR